jgi:hypothetical protein
LSPYERPNPRAITPRLPPSATWATASAMASGSGVDNTSATVGAVRPQPVSLLVLVVSIVKEGTVRFAALIAAGK